MSMVADALDGALDRSSSRFSCKNGSAKFWEMTINKMNQSLHQQLLASVRYAFVNIFFAAAVR